MSAQPDPASPTPPVPVPRALAGGFLMGLANLVPGVSGGTMILALGLYDAFIDAVARLTSFRWSVRTLTFVGLLGVGLVVAVLGLAGVAVTLIAEHRWIMYSLFIGMTLGGVPTLLRQARPLRPSMWVATAAGVGAMALLVFSLSRTAVPENFLTFVGVGALAASSMILPGVSGSYVLLVFGMYDVVVGSLSSSALREDPLGAAWVVGPVAVGAVLGIGLLSNVLKWFLRERPSLSHGLLLGLLFGSVLGLWPFQDAVHPDLATRAGRKAVTLALEGGDVAAIEAETGVEASAADLAAWRADYAGLSRGDLKVLSEELVTFAPSAGQVALALGLLVLGFALTQLLGMGTREEPAPGASAPGPAD